jgi:hypothetical protein
MKHRLDSLFGKLPTYPAHHYFENLEDARCFAVLRHDLLDKRWFVLGRTPRTLQPGAPLDLLVVEELPDGKRTTDEFTMVPETLHGIGAHIEARFLVRRVELWELSWEHARWRQYRLYPGIGCPQDLEAANANKRRRTRP